MSISLKNIHSLTEFKRNANVYVEQVCTSQSPLVLTVNGKAVVVIQDAESFQTTIDRLQLAETQLQELKLSWLRQELQVGIEQLDCLALTGDNRHPGKNYTEATIHELFDEIKHQGRSALRRD
ncbi:type II toxin-antitoxin system Phd/YefM family antitoxin [Chamaesiphon sp. VAR_48_metabat_403]|uniref:type II toxin-antitoxin system Phd/YefM family antitoxin n=1 Tax=Chamaesiphon sp. VAR_48_metabat_403 TaxID=2964700 RepID=UPI00286E77C3|nr:type II toxin-antitoxin system Phd/YefM family antitoxin [Chamaesiphon sp. VAR_48_metabat_403]